MSDVKYRSFSVDEEFLLLRIEAREAAFDGADVEPQTHLRHLLKRNVFAIFAYLALSLNYLGVFRNGEFTRCQFYHLHV